MTTTDTIEATAAPATAIAEYSPTAAALADLRQRYANVVWDVTTTKGDKEARAARRELVSLRTSLEEKRKELKAPALERSRLIDDEAKAIKAAILELEDPIDQLITAEEQRRERERAERRATEEARVDGIQRKIAAFGSYAIRAMGEPSAAIEDLIRELVGKEPDEATYQEFHGRAAAAHSAALAGLRLMLERTVQQEADRAAEAQRQAEEAARLAEERARLEAERLAEEQRRAEQAQKEAAERAERERQEAEARRHREEAEQREQARVNAIRRRFDDIRAIVQRAVGQPLSRLHQAHDELVAMQATEDVYAEFLPEAIETIAGSKAAVRQMIDAAEAAAREAAELRRREERLAEERAALERQRQEQEAAERRRQEEAEAQARAEREAAEQREREAQAERDRLAAIEAARLDRLHAAAPALLGACRTTVLMLKQLGGMLPGTKEVIDSVVEGCEAAISQATED